MLHRAENAELARAGWLPRRTWFWPGAGRPIELRLSGRAYRRITASQHDDPVALVYLGERTYWWFRDRFWWERDDLALDEVRALVLDRERRLTRRIQRAKVVTGAGTGAGSGTTAGPGSGTERGFTPAEARRGTIPDDVKTFVWQRDAGRCVGCATTADLEFDHVIPLVLGGANTARNLQLLCETCNRSKGGHLT